MTNSYEALYEDFKKIYDEYTSSESFKNWHTAKVAWEATETFKNEPDRYVGDPYRFSIIHGVEENYSPNEKDYEIYNNLYVLTRKLDWSTAQEVFVLKRKLLLIEYGLPSDTKLPGIWDKDVYVQT